jgi:hypothetical protein
MIEHVGLRSRLPYFAKLWPEKIPSKLVYQDDDLYAFLTSSLGRRFILMIPKLHIPQRICSRNMLRWDTHDGAGPKLAIEQGCSYPAGGFRVPGRAMKVVRRICITCTSTCHGRRRPWLKG